MSKRDDLDNEAKGEMGALAAILLAGGTYLVKRNKKDNLRMKIDSKKAEISDIERQISAEKGKFFLIRDDEKIRSLEQKKNQLLKEKNDLEKQYNKL